MRYIKDFSRIAKLIYDLLTSKNESKEVISTDKSDGKRQTNGQLPSSQPVDWKEEHQVILENLIQQLTSPPVMAYLDFKEPFILHTDASEAGLGTVIYQKQDGILRVIAMDLEHSPLLKVTTTSTLESWNFWHSSSPSVISFMTTCTTHHLSVYSLTTTPSPMSSLLPN